MVAPGVEEVTRGIVRRYANPGRSAYAYLFKLEPEADFKPLIPDPGAVISAWIDEGAGLAPAPAEIAVEQGRAVSNIPKPEHYNPKNHTPDERKQLMARSVLFSVKPLSEDSVQVHLISRSLVYSPKGDREVYEDWRRADDGQWYSAYKPRDEE